MEQRKVTRLQGIRKPEAASAARPRRPEPIDIERAPAEDTRAPGLSKPTSRVDAARHHLRTRSGWWWFAVVIVALVLVGLIAKDKQSSSSGPSSTMAIVACEDFVADRLKSPATADFGTASAASQGGGTYRVTGTVDAENSFGVMMRVDYSCTVQSGDDENWMLVDLEHNQR